MGTENGWVIQLNPDLVESQENSWVLFGFSEEKIDAILVESEVSFWVAAGTKVSHCRIGE